MTSSKEQLARRVACDHDCLLEQLRSLDNCLENIFYYGEVCSDLRGFGNLRNRCLELRKTLLAHIPEGEKMFAEAPNDQEVCRLLPELVEDHRALVRVLDQTLTSLEALQNGSLLPEDLFGLQERVRELSAALQRHIHTVNLHILARMEAT
ncbi:MAG: hypothetical protein HY656_04835 [Acidobacteria bacterium]|nr:hypothetical protein [Acidobacteriota bacterium]